MTRNTSRRAPLDQASIVAAAIVLADDQGVEALTMRNLADRLGYKVMALYNHVANKDELLSLMLDAVAAEVDEPSPDEVPLTAIHSLAVSTRSAFVRHPWAPALWQQYFPGPARNDHMECLLWWLDASGLSPELAHHGFHAVNNHVLGYTLQEQGMNIPDKAAGGLNAAAEEYLAGLSSDTHPHTIAHVHQHLNGETASSFELVLDLILDGLVRLNREH
jgi:AcrR family transcriptional regulator